MKYSSLSFAIKFYLLDKSVYFCAMKKAEFTQDVIDTIVSMYAQNIRVIDVARHIKTSNVRILDLLSELGLKRTKAESMRRNRGISILDNSVFDILTSDALYWIGFLYADGHIDKDRPRISVTVAEIDRPHLEKLNNFLGGGLNIVEVKVNKKAPGQIKEIGKYYRLAFSDKKIYEKLQQFGFTHNKTLSLDPHPLLKNSRDFWRGVVDGDGWICRTGCIKNSETLGLSGTESTIGNFLEFLNSSGVITKALPRKDKRANVWKTDLHCGVAVTGSKILYKNSTTYLDRKYEKYLSFIL